MKKLFFIFILFLTVQTVVNAQSKGLSEEGYKHWIKAITRMEDIQKESDYELIIKEFKEVVKTDPDFPDVYFNMGVIYAKMGELGGGMPFFENAKASFEKYKELKPSEKAEVLKELARLEVKMEDYKRKILESPYYISDLNLQITPNLGSYTWEEAKRMCSNLTREGFSDWYLPSKDELIIIRKMENGLKGAWYWSSTEINDKKAYNVYNDATNETKTKKLECICVRKINPQFNQKNSPSNNQSTEEILLTTRGSRVYKDNKWIYEMEVQSLMINTDALKLYKKGTNNKRGGNVLLSIGVPMLVPGTAYVIVGATRDKSSPSYDSSLPIVGYALLGTGTAITITGICLKVNSKKLIKKSVNMYNESGNLSFGFTPNSFKLSLTF